MACPKIPGANDQLPGLLFSGGHDRSAAFSGEWVAKYAGGRRARPFDAEDLRRYIEANACAIRAAGVEAFLPVAESLEQLASSPAAATGDLEALERHLSVLEEKLIAIARSRQSEADALASRQELKSQIRPWRGKMTGPQIAMLEAQFLDRAVLASGGLPRLSLFYFK